MYFKQIEERGGIKMNIYDYKFTDINKHAASFENYQGKVLLIVNIASKCGFTPQLEDLQKIYEDYKDKGFEIIGFPSNQFDNQSPGNDRDMSNFCKLNYGVTFKLSEKTDVRGINEHPVFSYLTKECPFEGFDQNKIQDKMIYSITEERYPEYLINDSIKWNFTKFLIDRNGQPVKRYEPAVEPLDILEDIKSLL